MLIIDLIEKKIGGSAKAKDIKKHGLIEASIQNAVKSNRWI